VTQFGTGVDGREGMRLASSSIFVALLAISGCSEHGKGGGPGAFDGGLGGKVCGGLGGDSQCPLDQFCNFAGNGCGAADETGICEPRPQGCPDVFEPVCGCDNQIHGNSCEASAAGVDLNAFGSCPLEAGSFACGFRQCRITDQYCQRIGSDIGGEPDSFGCNQVPSCPSQLPTCACLAAEPCSENCTGDGATGLTLTCLGG